MKIVCIWKNFVTLLFLVVNICAAKAQEDSVVTVMTHHEDINLTDVGVVALPTMGPFMIAENKLMSLDFDNSISNIYFGDLYPIDDVIWSEDKFVLKSLNALYDSNDLDKPAMVFYDETFSIYPYDKNNVYINIYHNDSSFIFIGNLNFGKIKRMVTIPEYVVYIYKADKSSIIVTESSIYMFEEDTCSRLMNFGMPIRDAVMTSKGLLFATSDQLFILTGVYQYDVLAEGKFCKLLYDWKYVYLITADGDLLRLNIDMFDF